MNLQYLLAFKQEYMAHLKLFLKKALKYSLVPYPVYHWTLF